MSMQLTGFRVQFKGPIPRFSLKMHSSINHQQYLQSRMHFSKEQQDGEAKYAHAMMPAQNVYPVRPFVAPGVPEISGQAGKGTPDSAGVSAASHYKFWVVFQYLMFIVWTSDMAPKMN